MSNVKVSVFIQEVKHELDIQDAEKLFQDLKVLFGKNHETLTLRNPWAESIFEPNDWKTPSLDDRN